MSTSVVEASNDITYHCYNRQLGRFTVTKYKAESLLRNIPLAHTPSNYPHEFGNGEKLKFAKGCGGSSLREAPLLLNGHTYNYNSHHPRDDPGPVRVIFTYPGKKFCGIITHRGRSRHATDVNPAPPQNQDFFDLCTATRRPIPPDNPPTAHQNNGGRRNGGGGGRRRHRR
ncbi:hypothetical protein HDU97_001427 [Phlyctochytrium planicorne]|nr:hypothetical protein HDU97_001427 [Phlyctochytrium planicorne]